MRNVLLATLVVMVCGNSLAGQSGAGGKGSAQHRWLDVEKWPSLHAPIVVSEIDRAGAARQQHIGVDGQVRPGGSDSFRIASVTKTYVAATVLRLVEQHRLRLDDAAKLHLAPDSTKRLRDDGYDMDAITIFHLLTHTSGMNDHAQQPQFIATWKGAPETFWTRERHLQALVEWSDPVARPGERFSYSDSGYVLLGQVIERVTGMPLAVAVRHHLGMDALGVGRTWWEQVERPRSRRAHQWLDGIDTYDWNASLDLYGGGGLVAPMGDVARFFQALLTGQVFAEARTLDLMLSAQGLPSASPYRIGIFRYTLKQRSYYGHAGFWGIFVAHDPRHDRTIAIAAHDQRDYATAKSLAEQHLVRLAEHGPGTGTRSQRGR